MSISILVPASDLARQLWAAVRPSTRSGAPRAAPCGPSRDSQPQTLKFLKDFSCRARPSRPGIGEPCSIARWPAVRFGDDRGEAIAITGDGYTRPELAPSGGRANRNRLRGDRSICCIASSPAMRASLGPISGNRRISHEITSLSGTGRSACWRPSVVSRN